jgi:hypothetical protein
MLQPVGVPNRRPDPCVSLATAKKHQDNIPGMEIGKQMKEVSSDQTVTQKAVRILGICLLVGILIYLLLMKNNEGISVAVKDDHLSLSYSSGDSFNINYQDVLSATETRDLDLGLYVSGTDTKKYKFGVWENSEFGEYNLCMYANVDSYIVMKTSNDIFVFNIESVDATDNFYKAFLVLLQTKQLQVTP